MLVQFVTYRHVLWSQMWFFVTTCKVISWFNYHCVGSNRYISLQNVTKSQMYVTALSCNDFKIVLMCGAILLHDDTICPVGGRQNALLSRPTHNNLQICDRKCVTIRDCFLKRRRREYPCVLASHSDISLWPLYYCGLNTYNFVPCVANILHISVNLSAKWITKSTHCLQTRF